MMNDGHEDDNDSVNSDDTDEALMSLLGGLSMEAMVGCTDWKEENNYNVVAISQSSSKKGNQQQQQAKVRTHHNLSGSTIRNGTSVASSNKKDIHSDIYQRAFQVSSNGQILAPPVEILDLSSEHKGNILVATRAISKGEVIFTEKALVGAQVARGICEICSGNSAASSSSGNKNNGNNNNGLYAVRGCQHCFKSLEPASCLLSSHNNMTADDMSINDAETQKKDELSIPSSELWPVMEYENVSSKKTLSTCERTVHNINIGESSDQDIVRNEAIRSTLIIDPNSRRATCSACRAIFCSRYCAEQHISAMGSCCTCTASIKGLIHAVCCQETRAGIGMVEEAREQKQMEADDCSSASAETESISVDVDPVLILATRMFIAQIQSHRNGESLDLFAGLCGEDSDIHQLELGRMDENTGKFTLETGYEAVSSVMTLTESERGSGGLFSLSEFHKVAAIAQRNAISLTTGSPFRTYYQDIIRTTGGRGSIKQKQVISQVARILGSEDGTLTRDMDRLVEEKVL